MSTAIARKLRKNMTRYEVKLWLRLRELRPLGFRFHRQVPINGFIVDFACFQSRIVIEVDGGQHGRETIQESDATRDQSLSIAGFLVLRFWNNEIWENIGGVIETILKAATSRVTMHGITP